MNVFINLEKKCSLNKTYNSYNTLPIHIDSEEFHISFLLFFSIQKSFVSIIPYQTHPTLNSFKKFERNNLSNCEKKTYTTCYTKVSNLVFAWSNCPLPISNPLVIPTKGYAVRELLLDKLIMCLVFFNYFLPFSTQHSHFYRHLLPNIYTFILQCSCYRDNHIL